MSLPYNEVLHKNTKSSTNPETSVEHGGFIFFFLEKKPEFTEIGHMCEAVKIETYKQSLIETTPLILAFLSIQ